MGQSLWPEVEHAPVEERPLLQVARLRRFGVNYLKDGEHPPKDVVTGMYMYSSRLQCRSPCSLQSQASILRLRSCQDLVRVPCPTLKLL